MKPQYIDTHSHIQLDAYDIDRTEVLNRAHDANIWMINVGTDLESSKKAVDLLGEGVYAIVGQHPTSLEAFHKEEYRKLLEDPRVIGIGECGLDFFRDKKEDVFETQSRVFREQIELAIELDKPLMIHARNSYAEILEILDEYLTTPGTQLRGNVHFFAGSIEEAQAFLDRGFTLSFTGVITFAKEYKGLVQMVPLDRIMSETDCPYVTPVPFRGTRNEPLYVREIAHKIADIKGIDVEIVKKALVDNAIRLFRLH